MSCAAFERDAVELALGQLSGPARDVAAGHAADCAACAQLLAELVALGDLLLELAPEADPPGGLEARALAAVEPPRVPSRRRWVALAAAAVLLLAGAAAWMSAGAGAPTPTATRTAELRGATGDPVGTVEVQPAGDGRLVVALAAAAGPGARWRCEVRTRTEGWLVVGSWDPTALDYGVWTSALPPAAAPVTAVRIVDAGGRIVATAELD